MGFFERIIHKNPEDEPVPKEELEKLGIKTGASMTREELNKHLKTLELQSSAKGIDDPNTEESLPKKMAKEVTNEQIDRAEQAAKERMESGR